MLMCKTLHMSTQTAGAALPSWDVADRMRKALRVSGTGVQDMADHLQVARNTVSTWINGRIEPSAQTLRLWALRTGVPFTWLCHGDLNPCDLRPRQVSPGQGGRSNSMQSRPTLALAVSA